MICTWIADVSSLLEENTYEEYYHQVPAHRREKADKLRFQADKALSVGVWILLEQMKKEFSLQEKCLYNLSHSGKYALCSVETGSSVATRLGCDVEKKRESKTRIAKHFFCNSESELIEKGEDFYRFWVLKESFQKATRMGMKLDMREFEIGFSEEGRAYLMTQPKEFTETYYFKEYSISEMEYCIAVCADVDDFAERIEVKKL